MKPSIDPKTKALLTAAFEKLPKRIVYPRCKKNRTRDAFGLRVMARDPQGVPTQIARQSWCRECRG
jgi:hypothetical protein